MTRLVLFASIACLTASSAAFAQAAAPAPAASAPPAVTTTAPTAKVVPSDAEKAARAKFRSACSADFGKFCADALPIAEQTPEQAKLQRGKMRTCIAAHQAEISAPCKAAIAERDAAVAAKKS